VIGTDKREIPFDQQSNSDRRSAMSPKMKTADQFPNFFLALLNHRSRHRPEKRRFGVRISFQTSHAPEACGGPAPVRTVEPRSVRRG